MSSEASPLDPNANLIPAHFTPKPEEGPLSEISFEVLQMILNKLDEASESHSVQVSLKWEKQAVEASKHKLVEFLNFLKDHTSKEHFPDKTQYDDLITQLKTLKTQLHAADLSNLIKIKNKGKELVKAVAFALEKMDEKGWHALSEANDPPSHLEFLKGVKADLEDIQTRYTTISKNASLDELKKLITECVIKGFGDKALQLTFAALDWLQPSQKRILLKEAAQKFEQARMNDHALAAEVKYKLALIDEDPDLMALAYIQQTTVLANKITDDVLKRQAHASINIAINHYVSAIEKEEDVEKCESYLVATSLLISENRLERIHFVINQAIKAAKDVRVKSKRQILSLVDLVKAKARSIKDTPLRLQCVAQLEKLSLCIH